MKLSKLKPSETFKTDSGELFQVLLMNKTQQRMHKERIKCRHIESSEIFYFNDIIVTKCKNT